jgi:tetratricopeptide (TPR) repeat protein
MATYINLPALAKTTAFTLLLLTCPSCLVIPVSAPSPSVPVILDDTLDDEAKTTQLEPGLEKTCYAEALTESEGRNITENSDSLESAADKLATAGKHKEAIRKYNESAAAALNEAIADGRAEKIDNYVGDVEGFRAENRPLIQKSAEFNFKIGQSYAQLGQLESAIDCFNGTLKVGILPPNDAIAYLNRGDAHERMGAKDKAKADFQQAANLFKKYKLPSYEQLVQKRLQATKK